MTIYGQGWPQMWLYIAYNRPWLVMVTDNQSRQNRRLFASLYRLRSDVSSFRDEHITVQRGQRLFTNPIGL